MHTSHWFTGAAILGLCSLSTQALANPEHLQTTPQTMAEAMAAERHSADSLNRLAGELGQQMGRQSTTNVDDLTEQLPFLNDLIGGLLDESGELRLPLGLTVYDAMGTTSVGFGTKF